jgi:hypothetical protein
MKLIFIPEYKLVVKQIIQPFNCSLKAKMQPY